MISTCSISGESFTVGPIELQLREKFGLSDSLPTVLPKYRFQELGAFWPHWNLHKRRCDKTGRPLVSIFREDCAYPVWHRDEWVAHANPPSQDPDFSRPFFDQAWELFQTCPLPHAFQSNNQNCEYTDDWYYSRNCYLCHSGQGNEDCRYCYGCDSIKDNHGTVFSFDSQLCLDLINSSACYNSVFLLNSKAVQDSAFLYDCRDCSDCLFCFNLRNKKYCFANEQLTKEEYEKKRAEWNLSSHKNYEAAKAFFAKMMKELAWHRALQIDKCENSTGNFIRYSKDCENCYLLSEHETCANVAFCGPKARTILDSLGTVGSELVYMSSLPSYSYEARFCFSTLHSRFTEYSAYLQNCQYCFGCCGLVNAKYCIFNKQYSKEDYERIRAELVEHMRKTGEWGRFFPAHFAPNPYEESFSGFYFPVERPLEKQTVVKTAELEDIPDSVFSLSAAEETALLAQVFWDESYQRPFQIQAADIEFSKKMKVPLPHRYYVQRMQENLKWMPFNGELRETVCGKSGRPIFTNWPADYDGRILSEEEYLKVVK
ncbi:MAG: hypothetical protein WC777_01305 [Candidatus Gracilibacteria bacterium]|jgi:hypothetical protein